MNIKLICATCFLLLVSVCVEVASAQSLSNYLEMGTSYDQNTSPGHISTIYIKQTTDASTNILKMDNDSWSGRSFGLYVEGGHIWPLSNNWAYGIGASFSDNTLTQKGSAYLAHENFKYPYQYDIRITQIGVNGRLVHMSGSWKYFIGAHLGLAYLSAKNYTNTSGSHHDYFYNNTRTQPEYGVSVGCMYAFTDRDGLSVSVGYTDFGKARFNQREMYSPASSANGGFAQSVSVLTEKIGFVHWF